MVFWCYGSKLYFDEPQIQVTLKPCIFYNSANKNVREN